MLVITRKPSRTRERKSGVRVGNAMLYIRSCSDDKATAEVERDGVISMHVFSKGRRQSVAELGADVVMVESFAGSVKLGIEAPKEINIVRDDAHPLD